MRTLKDISFYEDGCLQRPDIRKEYLRKLAKEWIEELEKPSIMEDNGLLIRNNLSAILWIKHFFNLE